MDRFNSMQIFVEVVEGESFTAAAGKLGLSRAQVSKSVAQLEAHLNTRLLNRTTRRISLTETGRAYYTRSKSILEEISEIENIAGEQASTPRGRLTIGAPTSFGMLYLNDAITQFVKQQPEIQISVHLTDRFIDIVSEGYDLVIRIAELKDSSLIAKKIAPCKRVYCAAPEYLKKHGEPKHPQDLTEHQCLIYTNTDKPNTWILQGPEQIETVRVSGPVSADNGDILKTAAVTGLGITLLPTFIVGPEINAGRLQQILGDYCPPDIAIYAVFPSRRYLSAKVRAFIDFLTEKFGEHPDWDRF